jgi:hypothetical protein
MALQTIRPVVAEDFNLWNLRISPELAGKSHTFPYMGKQITVKLPSIPKNPSFSEWHGDHKIRPVGWQRTENGEHLLKACLVESVEVRVDGETDVSVPEDYLASRERADLPEATAKKLQDIIEAHDEITAHAFTHWRDVMRSKTLDGSLGRAVTSWQARHPIVWDSLTNRYVYTGIIKMGGVFDSSDGMKDAQWTEIEALLAAGARMPVWFDFLFQGEYRNHLGDRVEAVVNFAIACELLIRRLFLQEMPNFGHISQGAMEVIDEVNVRAIMNKWPRMAFWSSSWQSSFARDALQKLLDTRNKVVHRGHRVISDEERAKFAKVARQFVIAADRLVTPPI